MEGGFHDHNDKQGKHAQHEVPRELLLEPGWHKIKDEPATEEIIPVVVRQNSWLFVLVTRITMKLFGMRFSRPCYDKPHRCPGWVGGGWKGARVNHCPEIWDGDIRLRSGYVTIDYEKRSWRWKFHSCLSCHVVTLPLVVRWTDWRSWWYEIRYFKNNLWFFKLET